MNISIGSKRNKSAGWKSRKRQQHSENQELRASLEAEKNRVGWREKNEVQQRIDAISKK